MLVLATMELVAHGIHAYEMHAYEMPRYSPMRGMPMRCTTTRYMSARVACHKRPPSIFGGLLKTPVVVAMVEPPVSYPEFTVPATACEMAISVGSAVRASFTWAQPYLNLPLGASPRLDGARVPGSTHQNMPRNLGFVPRQQPVEANMDPRPACGKAGEMLRGLL
jgi:hypothetical protein